MGKGAKHPRGVHFPSDFLLCIQVSVRNIYQRTAEYYSYLFV